MGVDRLSPTWVAVLEEIKRQRKVRTLRLRKQGVDERDADYTRGFLDALDAIERLSNP